LTLTPCGVVELIMQRFRLMGCYVVFVVAALGCTIGGIAILRAAAGH
jgi:hypothetical protein